MTGLAIGSIKTRDEISEVVVVIAFWTHLSLFFFPFCFLSRLLRSTLHPCSHELVTRPDLAFLLLLHISFLSLLPQAFYPSYWSAANGGGRVPSLVEIATPF